MKNYTLNLGTALKRSALVAVLGVGALAMNAQTFLYEGVVYKASGNKLTAQKPTTKPENGDAPGNYTGDIVVPGSLTYNGKDYVVTSIAGVFKGEPLTSIEIGAGVTTISRGCFQGCVNLTKAVLPSDLVTINGDLFSGCTALEEVVLPGTAKEVASNQFKGCTALKKLTIAEGPTAIEISAAAFPEGGTSALTEVVINREIGTKYTDMNTKPFRGAPALTTVTLGGSMTSIPTSYFESAASLKTVNFEGNITSLGTNVFAGSGIEEITLPASITTVPASTFQNCHQLKKVTLGDAVTSVQDMAFYNSTLSEINFPATLKSIGQMAFSGTKLAGELTLPEGVTSVGLQSFAGNSGLTAVNLPATLSNVGDGAFMGCTGIAKFSVGEGSAYTAESDGALLVHEGTTLKAFATASALNSISGAFTTVSPYAVYMAEGIASVDLPACQNWGDYCFSGTSIDKIAVQGTVGRYVAANCPKLTEVTIEGKEVPFGIVANDPALKIVNLSDKVATVKQDAFLNCTSLESLNLGSILAILEADAFKGATALKNITVTAANPAAMAEGVFTPEMDITVTVPVDLVDKYKNATGWKNLTIAGDANLASGAADMGMPNGLYYAGTDDKLHCVYESGETDEYEVGGVPHTFQLVEFKNRIYGASAGKKFIYSATGGVDGDGKLFYISKVGGETFQAVVLDNAGGNAYKDPFGLYIYGDTLYVNDRNVCIRKIPADAIALPIGYPSWVENDWLGFYGAPWTWGCIKAGWAITQGENAKGDAEPIYWVGMKYNGNGIYRFREEHVGAAGKPGEKPANGVFLTGLNPIFTTFHLDEANGHMYIYIEKAGSGDKLVKAGLYRINVADLEANPDPSDFSVLNPILVDGAPVKYEGSGDNEHVGISQLNPDEKGEYLYWCYRAPTEAEAASTEGQETPANGHYFWADKFDASNPLHQTGIKRLKLGEANPVVEMVAPGAEGYGVVATKYEGSKKQDGVNEVIVATPANTLAYVNGALTVQNAATVNVYNAAGYLVAYAALEAGESLSVDNLEAGVYVATDGNAVVKFVK